MWVMKYEGECIKTIEWVESYENCIKSGTNKRIYLSVSHSFLLNQIKN